MIRVNVVEMKKRGAGWKKLGVRTVAAAPREGEFIEWDIKGVPNLFVVIAVVHPADTKGYDLDVRVLSEGATDAALEQFRASVFEEIEHGHSHEGHVH